MIGTILRGLLLFGGIAMVFAFIALGVFFLAWVFAQRDNGW